MPNGFADSQESWNDAQAALSVVDTVIPECFRNRKFTIVKNYHEWPSRAIEWMDKGLKRKVQVYLSTESERSYNVWLCVSTRTGGQLLWKREFLRENTPWATLSREIREVLVEAAGIVGSWTAG